MFQNTGMQNPKQKGQFSKINYTGKYQIQASKSKFSTPFSTSAIYLGTQTGTGNV